MGAESGRLDYHEWRKVECMDSFQGYVERLNMRHTSLPMYSLIFI